MKTARFWASVLLSLALLMLAIGVAYAFTVTVDGNPADWGSTPATANDPNEEPVRQDGADIENVFHTTDSNKIYFRVDTYDNQTWQSTGGGYHWVMVCLNTDNDTSTGVSGAANCYGMTGIDYRIVVQNTFMGLVTGIQDCRTGTCSPATGAVVVAAYANKVLEISARLSDLNNLGSGCSSSLTVPTSIYWDGGDQDPDDNIPDNGTFNLIINCPTAVTVSSMSASANTSVPTLPFALAGLLGAGALGLFIVGRRR